MFANLFMNETVKNLRRRMLWVEAAILAILVAGLYALFFTLLRLDLGANAGSPDAVRQMESSITWPGALVNSLGFAGGSSLGGILLIILVGTAVAQEYGWRTLHLWLSRGTPRPLLLAARFSALLVAALLFVLTALLAGGLASAGISLALAGRVDVAGVDFPRLALALLRTAYTLLPYAGLAFLLAVATRSTAAAIGVGLAYSLLGEGLLVQIMGLFGGPLSEIGKYLPIGLAGSLMRLNGSAVRVNLQVNGQVVSAAALDPLPAALGIALWTVLFAGLALALFQRQDLTE